jgi:putative transposase
MPQSLANILVHIVFSTKNREPFIEDAIREELHRCLGGVLRNLKSPSLCINSVQDHIHILATLSRTIAIADLIEEIKTSSSKWKKQHVPRFQWQSGYGAFSIGQSQESVVRKYIDGQKEHHQRVTFQDEYRRLLQKYEIAYDERYVWD